MRRHVLRHMMAAMNVTCAARRRREIRSIVSMTALVKTRGKVAQSVRKCGR
jgi:hypothetical protein